MNRNQQGGVVAFIVVALSLFLALVAGVWAVREYGPSIAGTTESIVADAGEAVDDATDDVANDDADTSSNDDTAQEAADAPEASNQDEAAEPEAGVTGDDEEFAEVVETSDEENATAGPSTVGTTGPSSISSTGPSQIAETGPAETAAVVLPLAAMTAAGISFIRSRLSLSL